MTQTIISYRKERDGDDISLSTTQKVVVGEDHRWGENIQELVWKNYGWVTSQDYQSLQIQEKCELADRILLGQKENFYWKCGEYGLPLAVADILWNKADRAGFVGRGFAG